MQLFPKDGHQPVVQLLLAAIIGLGRTVVTFLLLSYWHLVQRPRVETTGACWQRERRLGLVRTKSFVRGIGRLASNQ